MNFILERLHVQERIVLECGKSYTCGRGKGNMIVCLGLQVSRKHCVFFHAMDKLFVTDLKSSNGIFINGKPQSPYEMVQLQQNDIVGIGCSDINPEDITLFAYKVYIARTSDPAEVANTSDMSTTVLICDTIVNQKQSNSDIHNASRDKRAISPNNCDMAVPCKIPKYKLDNNDNNYDINISEKIKSGSLPGPSTSTNLAQNDNSNTNNVEIISDTVTHIKEENDVEIIDTIFPETSEWNIGDKILKYETYLNLKLEKPCYQTNNKMDICIDKNNKGNSNNSEAVNEEYTTREKTNGLDKINDVSDLKGANFIRNNDQLIKLEDELQLTDEDEKAHVAVENSEASKTTIKLKKIKHEPKTRFSEIDIVDLSDNEDGIFPYSQLFDIKFENNVKQEVEIKQECTNNDIENTVPLDIDKEVIVLTDSEDDDNPWLHRLSRSQLMNEDKPDTVQSIIKDEIDLGIWHKNTSEIIQDSVPSTSKDFNKVTGNKTRNEIKAQSANIDTFEDFACKETFLEPKNIDKKMECDDNSDINLSVAKTDAMDVDEAGPSNEPSIENINHTAKQKTDAKENAEPHKQTEVNAKYSSRYATTRRVIPVIEAPHLPTRRGRHKSSDRKKDSNKDSNKDSSKDYSKAPETSEGRSPSSSTTEEDKIQKEQNKRTSKGSPDHTASSKQNRTSISKEEKKTIAEERKVKLKRIAEEEKLASDNNKNVKRGTAKPRVKISLKNRGDFLCNEQQPRVSKPPANKSAERARSSNKAKRATSTCESDVQESVMHDIEMKKSGKDNISKSTVNNVATSLEQSLSLNNILDGIKLPVKYNNTKDSNVNNILDQKRDSNKIKHKSTENTTNSSGKTILKSTEISAECASVSNKENSLSPKLAKTKKKGVTFATNVDIKEFAIESENMMKKLVGKDAPIPFNKLVKTKANAEWSPKLEEFLYRIFMWNPVWLEEQRYLKTEPPIVSEEELKQMKIHYESYWDYYRVMLPLLLLETWHSINRDFETVAKNAQHKTAMCSIVANTISRSQIPTTNLSLTVLMLEVLVTQEDLNRQSYPNFGDLVSLEYVQYNKNRKQTFHKVFAYVTSMNQMPITNFTYYNRELRNHVPNAHSVITYSIQTRPIEHDILLNRIHRVRTVTYLRANMRMVQALQYLPQSPLLNLILNPKIYDYQLPPFNTSFNCTSLVTKDNLNLKQLEAVSRVTDVVIKKEAKLCFIQGPPGTGKSKVIVNLVAQILYGKRENKNDKTKILLCAPSNAAIDEVVMRLLAIRSNLKHQYSYTFNLVRIGRPETMHPNVKPVSPSELAKRHLRKFTENVICWSSNSTTNLEGEKTKLQSQMEEFRAELDNVASLSEAKRRTIKRKLIDALARYELLISNKLFDDVNVKDRLRFQRSTEDIILAGADIIACTLSSCYTNQMESIFGANKERLSVCIVDEATQSCEAETLIPLMLGVNTLVLVGDPNQLPATILSQRAKKLGLDQSVFSRVQLAFASETNSPVMVLNTQYRMAHSISYWPNQYFYEGKLIDAVEIRLNFPFYPYRVLRHTSVQNNDRFSNTTEAEFVANMIYAMLIYAKWENANETITLGVLTPYNNQRTVILNKINEKISTLPVNMKKKIAFEVNTVDSFQGQERDIIIMSCVRSHGIGFMSDKQRLCVALTRAKHSLILCGNFTTFEKDPMWNSLIYNAKTRGVLCDVDANATSATIKPFIVK
ncbi:helicase SEN1 [Odontomachus brunneus]|uniref:helicase SEN1 n=1 Tax=Odontomachus brunneus TaxID=486640 RepID=UPI0013F253E3|nr:helicase SEN1 [Odontomachus brunneus]